MKLHRNEKYVKFGITAFCVFVVCAIFWIVFSNFTGFYNLILDLTGILSPLLYGFLFAYLMNPIMEFVKKWLLRRLEKSKLSEKRKESLALSIGLIASVLLFLAAIYALLVLIVPNLRDSLRDLLQIEKLESYYAVVSGWVDKTFSGTQVEEWFHDNLDSLLAYLIETVKKIDIGALVTGVTSSAYSVVAFIFDFFVGIVAAIYILLYKKQLCSQAKKITVAVFRADHADRLFEIARRTNRIFGGFVIGKIIDAILVGFLTYFALLIMGMPYAPLIGTIIGITNIIPFFGPFIGAVPSAILLLIENPIDAVYFALFILVLQLVDGYIIENRILGEKLGISDFWVLVSILLFGGVFGFAGMLLGVPVFAVVYTLIGDATNKSLRKKRYSIQTDDYYALQCVADIPVVRPTSTVSHRDEPGYDLNVEPEEEPAEEDAFETR